MKAAIWACVSTTDQETENQLSSLEAWASAKNLEVVGTYSINEFAYHGEHRSALEAMYRDAHQSLNGPQLSLSLFSAEIESVIKCHLKR